MSLPLLTALSVLILAACTPPVEKVDVSALTPCADVEALEEYSLCKIEADGRVLRVGYGADAVNVDVLTPEGETLQSFSETNMSEYLPAFTEDVDGDGASELLIGLNSGNANVNTAIWRYDAQTGQFVRLGEVSGVQRERTADGLLAVPGRSGAASWVVSYYRVNPAALTPIAAVNVSAEANDAGVITGVSCVLESSPGIESLNLTPEQAQARFCAEPTAQVFE